MGTPAVVLICVFSLYRSYDSFSRPDYEATAIVYHSESQGIDAGTEYIYSIYKKKDSNGYFYIKSKASITITGSGTAKDIKSGSINKKSDLDKITKDIEKDVESGAQKNVTYTFVDNSTKTEVKDITELGNKLFK